MAREHRRNSRRLYMFWAERGGREGRSPNTKGCRMRRTLLVVTAMIGALAAPGAASADDFADTALNIIPSGQYGSVPVPAGADTQEKMYDGLTPLFDHVTPADLTTYFKSEKFGVDTAAPSTIEPVPRAGVT